MDELVEGVYKCQDDKGKFAGTYSLKITEKSYILEGIEKPDCLYGCIEGAIWQNDNKKVTIPKNNRSKHCIRIWEDGDFTVYFFRSGTPHIFSLNRKI